MFAPSPFLALVRRDLLVSMRQGKTWLLIAIPVLLIGFIFIRAMADIGNATPNAAARIAESAFFQVSSWLCVAVVLLVTVIAAPSVVIERQRNTFEMLRASAMTARVIVLGKIANAIGITLCFIVAILPVVGVLLFFTGVNTWAIAIAGAVLLFLTLYTGSISILVSILSKSTTRAMGWSFFWILFSFLIVLPTLMSGIFAFVCGLIFAGLCVVSIVWSVDDSLVQDPRFELAEKAVERDPEVILTRRRCFPWYIVDPLLPTPPIPDSTNPVFAKDVATTTLAGTAAVFRKASITTIVCVFIMAQGLFGVVDTAILLTWVFLLFIPMEIVPVMTREFEEGTAEMLETTLLSRESIFWGKFHVALRSIVAITGGILVGYALPLTLVELLFHEGSFLVVAMGSIALLSCAGALCGLSLFASILLRRTVPALVATYLCVFAVLVLPTVTYPLWSFLSDLFVPVNYMPGTAPWMNAARLLAGFLSPVTTAYYAVRLSEFWGSAYMLGHCVLLILVATGLYRRARRKFIEFRLEDFHHGA